MFSDLDETIRQLLIRFVPLDLAEVDVGFEAPDREWSGKLSRPTVNCFLYAVQMNLELRESGWKGQRHDHSATRLRSHLRVDACYQVTAWARAPEDEHLLLWRVLAALARHPLLPTDLLQGSLADQPFPIPTRVARPDQKPPISPADLWQALDNRIRPALSYAVTLALDPEVAFTSPLVFTRRLRVDQLDGHAPPEAVLIGGRVRDRLDVSRGVAGVSVLLRETGAEVTTDAEGRFTFLRAPRGPITLVAQAPGRLQTTRTLAVPSEDYDLEV